ncbi:MAG: hypothetical protein HQL86_07355, partial [Magnetococcales bacterium]|nr:hypothetical protein [Magnetococcales bacterium]
MNGNTSPLIFLYNGKDYIPVRAGFKNHHKAKAGEQYRIVTRIDGKESLLDDVVARRSGEDLHISHDDGTEVIVEAYYSECETVLCGFILPGDQNSQYEINNASPQGETLADGSSVLYMHGHPDALMNLVQNNAYLQSGLTESQTHEVTYIPESSSRGLLLPVGALGAGGVALGASGGSSVLAPVVAPSNVIVVHVVGGPVVPTHGLAVNIFKADGETLLATGHLDASGNITFDSGDYVGVVIARLANLDSEPDYMDEATAQAIDLNAKLMVSAMAKPGTTTLNMNLLTTIAAIKAGAVYNGPMASEITEPVVQQANDAVAQLFGLDDLVSSPIVTTVDTRGDKNSDYTPEELDNAEKYGAILAALSGMDAVSGGNPQSTIEFFVSEVTITQSTVEMSQTALNKLIEGAYAATTTSPGEGVTSLTGVISELLTKTSLVVSIGVVAQDNVIDITEQHTTITGTTVENAQVHLQMGGVERSATVTGATWSYTLSDNDIENMGQGGETITVTATLADQGSEQATRSIVIDTAAPTIQEIRILSATGIQNQTLNAGDVVTLLVTMNEPTTVSGTPSLAITIGEQQVIADYQTGSGTILLTFSCTIQNGQNDLNGIGLAANALLLNGGSLIDGVGNPAILSHEGVADNANYRVDTRSPTLQIHSDHSVVRSGEVATMTFTFSEDPGASFTDSDIVTTGGTLGPITGTGLTRTATFTPMSNVTSGTASITVAGNRYTDAAGNPGGEGVTPILAIQTGQNQTDTEAPTLSITSNVSTLKAGETATI